MIEAIKKLNKDNKEEFIKEYGLVSDTNIAKQLLCITSNAWLVLDDSLKSNSDIIMYYQPVGILEYDFAEDMGGVFETTKYGSLPQEGFKLVKQDIQIPNINFPKDFDIDQYIRIQEDLSLKFKKYSNYDTYYRGEQDMGDIVKNIEFAQIDNDRTVSHFKYQESPKLSTTYMVYDRSRLERIVNSYLNENSLQDDVKKR